MKKVIVIALASIIACVNFSFANEHKMKKDEMKKEMGKVEKKVKTERPINIDKNNVGITKNEKLDQSDPNIIEGNLEDNDFKN